MNWCNSKGQISISVPFKTVEGTPEELLGLVQSLRAGTLSREGKHKIVLTHLKYALRIASSLSYSARWYKNDLASVAFLAVVEAVDKAQEKLIDDNITSYIAAAVESKVWKALNKGYVFRQGHSYLSKHKAAPVRQITKDTDLIPKESSDQNMWDLREDLKKVVTNRFESRILELREEGYKDREISDIIGCSPDMIQRTRKEIEKRWIQLEAA